MERLLCVLIGYAFGCFQTSYLAGKWLKHTDIRNYGSGNAGATNAVRVLGLKTGIACMLLDILKAALALWVVMLIFGSDRQNLILFAGFGAILGHNHPFYMNFRGGKGVSVTLGILAVFDWHILLVAAVLALIVLFFTKYVSLASFVIMITFPIGTAIFHSTSAYFPEMLALSLIISGIVFWRHRANIKRLLNGTENRFGQGTVNPIESK